MLFLIYIVIVANKSNMFKVDNLIELQLCTSLMPPFYI